MFTSGVLVVDDDVNMLALIKARLAASGIESDTADSAEDALRQLGKRPYSVIVSDIDMPGMNGMQLIPALKGHSPLVQVIMLTASPSISRVIECADCGAVDFFSKMDDFSILIESVRTAQTRLERWKLLIGTRSVQNQPSKEVAETAAM